MDFPPIFTVTSPSSWQAAPEWMNVHYLLGAERCPRSVALRYAQYPDLWDRNGYPDKPTPAALAGTVVHIAVGRIVRHFAESGSANINDPRCTEILRTLGGYTTILKEIIENVGESLTDNPRFEVVREWSLTSLRNRIPLLREQIQLQLAKLSWSVRPQKNPIQEQSVPGTYIAPRLPLKMGTYFEVEVRDPKLCWKGIIDFVEVGTERYLIKEFKTGERSDDHIFQLKIYALLWLHDRDLNPGAVPASTLIICYPTGEEEIVVDSSDLERLRASLTARTDRVRTVVNGPTPPANLSDTNCPNCDVRHLCAEYWMPNRRHSAKSDVDTTRLMDDVELQLKTRKSERTWLAECRVSNHFQPKTDLLLRWSSHNTVPLNNLKVGMRVRLCGATVSLDKETGSGIVSTIANTDVVIFN